MILHEPIMCIYIYIHEFVWEIMICYESVSFIDQYGFVWKDCTPNSNRWSWLVMFPIEMAVAGYVSDFWIDREISSD